ncbi:MAG: hypothetical protein AB2A00_23630 [Myxococcota bacterium]
MTTERQWGTVVYLLCCILYAGPLLSEAYLPLVDLPQHMHLVQVKRDMLLGGGTVGHFRLAEPLAPYWVFYALATLLSLVVGAEWAVRLLLALALALTPLAVRHLARTWDRETAFTLLAFPLACSFSFWMGFASFVFAVPLGLLLVAEMSRCVMDPARSRRNLTLLGMVLYFTHVQVLALAGLWCVVVTAPCWLSRRRDVLHACLALVPAGVLLVGWLFHAQQYAPPGSPVDHVPPAEALSQFWRNAMGVSVHNAFVDGTDGWSMAAVAALLLLAFAYRPETRRAPSVPFAALAAVVATLVVYLVSPSGTRWQHLISQRYVGPMLLLALAAVPAWTVRHRTAQVLCAVVAVATGINFAVHLKRFSAQVGPFDEAIQHVKPGTRTVALMLDNTSPVIHGYPLLHYGVLMAARRDTVPANGFGRFPQVPVQLVDRSEVPAPSEFEPQDWDADAMLVAYDHVLIRNRPGERFDALGAHAAEWTTSFDRDGWVLHTRVSRWKRPQP